MSSSTKPIILIIDNDEGVTAAISTRLESMGYVCLTAGTGAQGLSEFAEHDIDLVITDLNMPGGDGIALAHSIRDRSDVPIVIVTGFQDDYKRELRGINSITLLRKPFETDALLDVIETELMLKGCELP